MTSPCDRVALISDMHGNLIEPEADRRTYHRRPVGVGV